MLLLTFHVVCPGVFYELVNDNSVYRVFQIIGVSDTGV